MAKRYRCDLSHFSFSAGDIGKLQTLSLIPVMAGDSMSLNLEGVFRLSPLRRSLVVDCNVDLFAFYVPHRHTYGEDWIDFIKDGLRNTVTFPSQSSLQELDYMGTHYLDNEQFPSWVSAGYNDIWNRYFRSPTDNEELVGDEVLTTSAERVAGRKCGYLPTPWSTGVTEGVDPSFRDVPSTTSFDIADLNRVQAQYSTDVDRTYFGERYNDILNTAFGSTVNTDADQRPTLIGRNRFWLSGYDVDGTDDAALGSHSGKSSVVGKFSFRRKFFPEHGGLWIMALLRFPTIHVDERAFLLQQVDASYLEQAGDPALVSAEPPVDMVPADFFSNGSGSGFGAIPFGQHYRYHPNIVHRLYKVLDGYSFIDTPIDTQDKANYVGDTEYDDVFQTNQLRHWNVAGRLDISCQRTVPPSRSSLYAGV